MSRFNLPPEAFVRHAARRLQNPTVLWRHSSWQEDPASLAFVSPLPGEEGLAVHGPETELSTDRYGGRGIVANGGSGRCCNVGDVQVKGVGKTLLTDPRTPDGHAYGGMTLLEGAREVLWAAFLRERLTHGVVEPLALIDTGSTISVPLAGGKQRRERRALLLRQSPLRLAHFMAATDFRPRAGMVSEHDRMASVIPTFPTALHAIYGEPVVGTGPATDRIDLASGLMSLLDRLASQLAETYAWRVVHGGLSPSNLCLDGRLLDFGMTTSVSGHARIIASGRSPDMVDQPHRLYMGVEPLFFYLEKFGSSHLVPEARELQQYFHAKYDAHVTRAIDSLLELPERARALAPPDALGDFVVAARRLCQPAIGDPFKLYSACPDFDTRMPPVIGANRDRALIELYRADGPEHVATRCEQLVAEPSARHSLIRSFLALKEALRERMAEDAPDWLAASRVIEHRVQALDLLTGPELNRRIRTASDAGELSDFLARTLPRLTVSLTGSTTGADAVTFAATTPRYSNFNVHGRGRIAEPSEHEVVGWVAELHGRLGRLFERPMLHLENVVRAAFRRDRLMLFFSEDRDLVGYAAVATVGPATLSRLEATRRAQLHPSEWLEGEVPVVIDMVCMPGRLRHIARRAREMLREDGRQTLRFLRSRRGQSCWREWTAAPATRRSSGCRCGRPLEECAMRR
jgi:hypothetical protein